MSAIKSVESLCDTLISKLPSLLKYLLTYKLSQNHRELFFATVRPSVGCNNNPLDEPVDFDHDYIQWHQALHLALPTKRVQLDVFQAL